MSSPIIGAQGLHKWYHGVHALRGISLDLLKNEAVGLIGDNGAGKSTLINILSGAQQADKGKIFVEGMPVNMRSTQDAMKLGIETIYQYNATVPTMSIVRNLFIGRELLKFSMLGFGIMDFKKMAEETSNALRAVGIHLHSPDALVGELSGGQRQAVAIARAMYFKSKVMILDEPTNHLAAKETVKVLDFIRSLKKANITSIFISHNIPHVLDCCDRIVAMARGKIALDKKTEDTQMDEIMAVL